MHLFTHMEMATLFFCRTSDLYLKENGITAFLMPISVITAAQQHTYFKKFNDPLQQLYVILDFQKIRNIFSLPTCGLIAKKGLRTVYPVQIKKYHGKVNKYKKNEKLNVIGPSLSVVEENYDLPVEPTLESYSIYYNKFKEGAALGPRNLWFVQLQTNPTLGINVKKPPVRTSEEVERVGKDEWKDIQLDANIESDYIYSTILGKDLIPFGYVKFRPVVLPCEPSIDGYRLFDIESLRNKGVNLIVEWVQKNQELWIQRATQKAKAFSVIEWLNYMNKLTSQNPHAQYVVVYNARGADAMAYVIIRRNLPDFKIGRLSIKPRNFVADTTTFYYETNDMQEAYYLSGVLNSRVINDRVKPFQPKGNYGFRDIGRRPLMLSIPRVDSNNNDHHSLFSLSVQCHDIVKAHVFAKSGFKSMRKEALGRLEPLLARIDELVISLLGQ